MAPWWSSGSIDQYSNHSQIINTTANQSNSTSDKHQPWVSKQAVSDQLTLSISINHLKNICHSSIRDQPFQAIYYQQRPWTVTLPLSTELVHVYLSSWLLLSVLFLMNHDDIYPATATAFKECQPAGNQLPAITTCHWSLNPPTSRDRDDRSSSDDTEEDTSMAHGPSAGAGASATRLQAVWSGGVRLGPWRF